MFRFMFRRMALMVLILFSVSFIIFSSVRMIPGDPAQLILGERATAEALSELRVKLGLDKPFLYQYGIYLKEILTEGSLGTSIVTNNPVLEEVAQKLPATMELAFTAMLIALIIGISVGILAAMYRNTWIDNLSMVGALTGVSMPIFWLGLLLMTIFAAYLGWVPLSGRLSIITDLEPVTGFYLIDSLLAGNGYAFFDALHHLILPAVTLATVPTAIIARMTRASMLEVLEQDYIKTAHAKGVAKLRVVLQHALRNAAIPITTIAGLQLGLLLSGAVLTETIFAWNGLGSYVVNAVNARDFPVVQGCVLIFAFTFILVNLLVDLSYFALDPRIRDKGM
ncbi:MAG: peptide ABC transporter permease [Candidatus Melainabacteria bacterium HGW-Melainabacteria-1]|nr:MAG: peptide ABC transporter permease [Candidatus Melainabacteria bacterium HGW-Melainabacteria-1]